MKSVYKKHFLQCLLLLATVCGWQTSAFAQTIPVSGRVTSSANGEPLPGVTIVVKGTALGSTTDINGDYTVNGVEPNGTLVFSYVGFATQEVPVNNRSAINVTLATDTKGLGEVVVIGYGTRERRDLTGAVSDVKAEDIQKSPFQSPELAMQGRMPGVFVSTPGGNPNARPTVRIRGVGTFGYAEPLYVVDGIPLTEFGSGVNDGLIGDIRGNVNVLNMINPNDIESISVLKDASAAAIYGVRASNGVILITTKKGRSGAPRVEVSASKGVQNIPNRFEMLNVEQVGNLYREAYANNPNEADNLPDVFKPDNPAYLGGRPTVDWQTPLINRNAAIEDYTANISGGSESTTYYFSGGFNRTESPLIQNFSERYSLAANVDSRVSKYIRAGVTYRLGYIEALDNTDTDLRYVSETTPWQQIYDPNHPTGYAPAANVTFKPNPDYDPSRLPLTPLYEIDETTLLWGPETNSNVFAFQDLSKTNYTLLRNMGTAYFEVEPITGLRVRGTLNADWYYNRRNTWEDLRRYAFSQTPGNPYAGHDGTAKGSYGERHSRNTNIMKEVTINYARSFGEHNFDLVLNGMDQKYQYELIFGSNPVFSADPRYRGIGGQVPYIGLGGWRQVDALQGYMGRLSYNYASKYYFDATVRRDGTSRFAPGYKWGTFPSFAAAWRISAEPFMQDMTFITDFKIRAGWGQLGNQETSSFAFLSTISMSPDYAFGSGAGDPVGVVRFGARLPDFPVLDLSWETAQTTNIGVDAGFLSNRVTLTAEYYIRDTKDILQSSRLPGSVGNENDPVLNIATVRNSGVELQVNYNGQIGDISYNIGGNLTTVRNRVLRLFRDQPFGGEGGRIEVGKPLFYLWGYQVGGIFQTQAEIDQWKQTYSDATNGDNFAPGDMWFKDVYGNPTEAGQIYDPSPDGVINNFDRAFIGKTIPGYFYGANLGAGWRNFDLSVFFQGIGDVQKFNGVRASGEHMSGPGNNQWVTTLNRWTPERPSTTMPRAVRADPAGNNRYSDRFVENAGFLRLKNFQVGYSLPEAVRNSLGFVNNLRVYVAGTNVFTFTQWTGLDPENDLIPPTRVFSLGINAAF